MQGRFHDAHQCSLAGRQLVAHAVGQMGDGKPLKTEIYRWFGPGQPVQPAEVGQELPYPEALGQRQIPGREAHLGRRSATGTWQDVPGYLDVSLIRGDDPEQHHQCGGLARTVWAEQRHPLAAVDGETHPCYCQRSSIALDEADGAEHDLVRRHRASVAARCDHRHAVFRPGRHTSCMANSATLVGPDGARRCWWALSDPLYVPYHDDEWGLPVSDDAALFEKLCLEGFQAGLSWLTILRKRPAFRAAFSQFDFDTVARFADADIERLMNDPGIVRHRAKITSTINNASRAIELRREFGSLAAFVWRFEPKAAGKGRRSIPSQTDESRALSRDLKLRGWSFVGPTTVYAFMQAMGLVNDHLVACAWRTPAEAARRAFSPPTG